MVNVNDFFGKNDSEKIQNAVNQRGSDGIVLIPPREPDAESSRSFWLLDSAILIPENTSIIMQNSTIKLSDSCRDNFFRSANCGMGIEDPKKIKNIHIRGEGLCTLEGADYPRATGDSSKELHNPCPHLPEDVCKISHWVPKERRESGELDFWDVHNYSYGTDAGKEGESQKGDWRGIGILFANAEDFSISNLRIVKSHGWGISVEACSKGEIKKIDFDACMYKEIDGMLMNMENQDGIDIRNGCHHIIISDITGNTGDDVIALTAIANPDTPYKPGGSLCSTHVMHNDWSRRERDIHDIIITNVIAHSYLCYTVRLLPALTQIYNVTISNVIDTAPSCTASAGTILLGDMGFYGENKKESLKNINISNVICNSRRAVIVDGYLADSAISGIINKNPDCPPVSVAREDGFKNVMTSNLV